MNYKKRPKKSKSSTGASSSASRGRGSRAVQRRRRAAARGAELEGAEVGEIAQDGVAAADSPLPHADRIQQSFGRHDVSGIGAAVGGAAADASAEIGAQAYATGNKVAFAEQPSLHLAAHEAAHVVQQRAGVQLSDGVGSSGDRYEKHADAVADAVVRGESAEGLLDEMAPAGVGAAVQRQAVQRQPVVQRQDPVDQQDGEQAPAGQCSEGPRDQVNPGLAANAIRARAGYRATQLGTEVPDAAIDTTVRRIERLVTEGVAGDTGVESENIGNGLGLFYEWSIRATVEKVSRRCGDQRVRGSISSGGQSGRDAGTVDESTDMNRTSQSGSASAGREADNGPTHSLSGSASNQDDRTRRNRSERRGSQQSSQSFVGEGDAEIVSYESEYIVTWTVETKFADSWSPVNLYANAVFNDHASGTPWTWTESTSIGTLRTVEANFTPPEQPQPRRRRRRRLPQRLE